MDTFTMNKSKIYIISLLLLNAIQGYCLATEYTRPFAQFQSQKKDMDAHEISEQLAEISEQLAAIHDFSNIDEVARFLDLMAQLKQYTKDYGLENDEAEVLDFFHAPRK
jgi:hypothetical protein